MTPAGTIIGRNDNVCGQIGMISVAGTVGCTMEAPADAAYAVLPVGVAITRPVIQTAASKLAIIMPDEVVLALTSNLIELMWCCLTTECFHPQ